MTRPLRDRSAHYDRERAREVARLIRAAKDPRLMMKGDTIHMPPWWVLAHRTMMGLINVVGRLDTHADLGAATIDALAATPLADEPAAPAHTAPPRA